MRRPFAPCACMLALITGVWFGQAYALFAPINSIQADDTTAKSAVSTAWRFYDAIDLLLRTADDSALLAVIAPDFVDHVDDPGARSNREGLVRYLVSLRDTHPALRLRPADVVVQGNQVVARLAPMGTAGGTILGIPLIGKEPWPRVEVIRVHDGRIVERWGDPAGYAPATRLFSETLTFSHLAGLLPALRRVTIVPGLVGTAFAQKGPAIISIESGELDVTTAHGGEASPSPLTLASGQPKTLVAGDSYPIADGVDFAVANRTSSPAVFLVLVLVQPMSTIVAVSDDRAETGIEGITIQDLTGITAIAANSRRLSIDLARVALAPGVRLAPHPVVGLELVVVETGAVTAIITGNPSSAWLRDPTGRSVAAEDSAQTSAGFSLTVASGATTAYANESTQMAILLLLTLTTG